MKGTFDGSCIVWTSVSFDCVTTARVSSQRDWAISVGSHIQQDVVISWALQHLGTLVPVVRSVSTQKSGVMSLVCVLSPAGRWVDWLDGVVGITQGNWLVFVFMFCHNTFRGRDRDGTLFVAENTLSVHHLFRQDGTAWLFSWQGPAPVWCWAPARVYLSAALLLDCFVTAPPSFINQLVGRFFAPGRFHVHLLFQRAVIAAS